MFTPQVQEVMTRLGSRLPYGEAQEEIELLWGVTMSQGSVRRATLMNGQMAVAISEQKVAELERTSAKSSAKPEQLVVSVDGAMIHTTGTGWREVKTVALGEFKTVWSQKKQSATVQTEKISYFSRLSPAETFQRQALDEWHERGGECAKRVVAINDGAVWIQSFIDYHCPNAIRVIDFAHAQSQLATIGRTIYGAETEQFTQWYAKTSKQLGQQSPQRLLPKLRLLERKYEDHPNSADIAHAIRYLDSRQAMIDYPHFRRIEIPIGSGIVESGHKVVMQSRMKRAGMRWAESSVNPMLALRTAICNGRWYETWQAIEKAQRVKKQAKKTGDLHAKPETEIVTQVDCQRLEKMATQIEKKQKKRPWANHDWIFLYKRPSIRRN